MLHKFFQMAQDYLQPTQAPGQGKGRVFLFLLSLALVACTATLLFLVIPLSRPAVSFTVEDVVANRHLHTFGRLEYGETGPFRWSLPQSKVVVDGFRDLPIITSLRLASSRPPTAPIPKTSLARGGWKSQPFVVGKEWRHYHLLVPPQPAHIVHIQTALFQPGGGDTRQLGVQLSHTTLTLPSDSAYQWHILSQPQVAARILLPLLLFLLMGALARHIVHTHTFPPAFTHPLFPPAIAFLGFIVGIATVTIATGFPSITMASFALKGLWIGVAAMAIALAGLVLRAPQERDRSLWAWGWAWLRQGAISVRGRGKAIAQHSQRALFLIAVAIVLMANMGLSGYGLNDSQYNLVLMLYNHYAENYVTFGYLETKLGLVQDLGESLPSADHEVTRPWLGSGIDPNEFRYRLTHGNVTPLLVSLSYHLFGMHGWSLRLPALLLATGTVGVVMLLARDLFQNRWSAVMAGVFAALAPIQTFRGNEPMTENLAIFFCILAFYYYWRWFATRRRGWLYGFFLTLIVGAYTDWNAYFVVPPLLLHYLAFEQGRRDWRFVVALAATPLLLAASYIAWTSWLLGSSSFEPLLEQFFYRRDSAGQFAEAFTKLEYWGTFYPMFKHWMTLPLLLAAIAWLGVFVAKVAKRKCSPEQGIIAGLFLFAASRYYVFKNHTMVHEQVSYYAVAFFALAAAALLTWVVVRWYRTAPVWVIVGGVVFGGLFAEQAIDVFRYETDNLRGFLLCNRDHPTMRMMYVAQAIREEVPGEAGFLSTTTLYPHDMIANRRYVVISSLDEFHEKVAHDPSLQAVVLPNHDPPGTETDPALRAYLVANHPRIEVAGYSLFDLTSNTSTVLPSSPHLSQIPASRQAIFDGTIELLGTKVQEIVTPSHEPISFLDRYLYRCPEVNAADPQTVRVVNYWRKVAESDTIYDLHTQLRSHLSGYILQPRYAGLDDLYPTSLWEVGAVVRDEFEITIPRDAPYERYTMAVEVRREGETTPVPATTLPFALPFQRRAAVAEVDIRPPELNQPALFAYRTVEPPEWLSRPPSSVSSPTVIIDDTFALTHYVSPTTESEIVLSTRWEVADDAPNHIHRPDYELGVQVDHPLLHATVPFAMTPPRLWQAGDPYYGTVRLSPYLPNGTYDLSISARDEKGNTHSFPLTTVDWNHYPMGDVAPIMQLGVPDGSADDLFRLSPNAPQTIEIPLSDPQAVDIIIGWTGKSEFQQTRVEIYAHHPEWRLGTTKFLGEETIEAGRQQATHIQLPRRLTFGGSNRIMLAVSSDALAGWRHIAATIIPDMAPLLRTDQLRSGWVEVDFIQVVPSVPSVPSRR